MIRGAVRSERGTVSAMVVVLAVFLMIMAGLVVDGGTALNARQRAIDDAEQAARVAANQIDEAQLRSAGVVVVTWPAAADAAAAYLQDRGYAAAEIDVSPGDGGSVVVTVSDTIETRLLSLAFIPSFTVTGRATARPAVGIDQESS